MKRILLILIFFLTWLLIKAQDSTYLQYPKDNDSFSIVPMPNNTESTYWEYTNGNHSFIFSPDSENFSLGGEPVSLKKLINITKCESSDQLSLIIGGGALFVQKSPTYFPMGPAIAAGLIYERKSMFFYAKGLASPIRERFQTIPYVGKDYYVDSVFGQFSSGLGAKIKRLGLGVGLSLLTRPEQSETSLGVNITSVFDYPLAKNLYLFYSGDVSINIQYKESISIFIGLAYKI